MGRYSGSPGQISSEAEHAAPPAVLTIAGFDPASGAGFTADLKVFAAHGLYGLACPTALTVQSTRGVRRSEPVSATLVSDTLACLAEDIPIAGVKIGMLATGEIVQAVARWLRTVGAPNLPVVLDPVLRSSSGHPLLEPEGLAAMRTDLLPWVSVLTPNLLEAALLSGMPVATRADAEQAARSLLGAARAVVLTGGHFGQDEPPDDLLVTPEKPQGIWLSGPRIHTRSTHGTGCAFSSALLAHLVLGRALPTAARAAKDYVRAALEHAYPLGRGRGPMHHLFALPQQDLSVKSAGRQSEPSK